jgi:PII-like signaling protein
VLSKGPAKKVTIYVNADTRHRLSSLHEAILNFLLHKGVSGATATRAMSGFGVHHQLHTPRIEVLAEHLPVRIEFVESARKVDELLPTLYDMVTDGLIEVQDTTVVKVARKEHKPEPSAEPHEEKRGPAKLLRIFLGEADESDGEPLYEAIVKRLRMMEISGATVYRGILGYGVKGHTHKEGFWHLSRDMPIMISVIDTAEKIEEARKSVENMLGDGLIVVSDVDMIRLVRRMPSDTTAE